ncbi:MAG TPA: 4-hydroxy-tetrahydrodipicolinate reductase [Clostridia bacterium]
MTNVLMVGCNGSMGQIVTRLADESDDIRIVAGYYMSASSQKPYPVYNEFKDIKEKIDVIIDFSHPSALANVLKFAVERRIPLVEATTGLSQGQISELYNASSRIPVFFSANMSLGVNLLIDLVKKAARILEKNFDIEIIEKHHNQKIDAPSGTALAIADALNSTLSEHQELIYDRHSKRKKRGKQEIGIYAVRGGTITGEHSVIFAGNDEIIEINHIAMSKEIFGVGALRAAKFLSNMAPGLYNMNDLIATG